jgi:hypothetical protein
MSMEEKPLPQTIEATQAIPDAFRQTETKAASLVPVDPRTANLTHRWKPGQTGNPGGRRKPTPLLDALTKRVTKELGTGANAQTVADGIAARLVQIATASKSEQRALDAITLIFERVEGKPMQRVENTGADGGPMLFETPASRAEAEARIAELFARVQNSTAAAKVPGQSG